MVDDGPLFTHTYWRRTAKYNMFRNLDTGHNHIIYASILLAHLTQSIVIPPPLKWKQDKEYCHERRRISKDKRVSGIHGALLKRGGLPGLPLLPPLAFWLRLPPLRRQRLFLHKDQRSLPMLLLPLSGISHRRHGDGEYPHPAHPLVLAHLPHGPGEDGGIGLFLL